MTLALLTLASLLNQTPAQVEVKFQRTYTVKDTATYHFEMEYPGGAGSVKTDFQTTVVSLAGTVPTVSFKTLSLDAGFPNTEALPAITTPLSPNGMPTKASIKTGETFFVFFSAAAMTSGTPVKTGDTVKVHWQNDLKEVIFDGTGKIGKIDNDAKTMIVDWTFDMKPSYTDAGTFTFKSVYSTTDFSLVSTEGTMGMAQYKMKVKAERKKAKA